LVLDGAGGQGLDVGLTLKQEVFRSPRMGLLTATMTGVQRSTEVLTLTVQGIRQLFRSRDTRLNEVVAGPIRITAMVGQSAASGFRLGIGEGFASFFQFVSLLSIAIAMMNLLPLPALDGGLIMISAAEAATKRPLAPKTLWRFQFAGFIVIVGLLFLAVASDILSFVG
jgi:regulator of sigma E protease